MSVVHTVDSALPRTDTTKQTAPSARLKASPHILEFQLKTPQYILMRLALVSGVSPARQVPRLRISLLPFFNFFPLLLFRCELSRSAPGEGFRKAKPRGRIGFGEGDARGAGSI